MILSFIVILKCNDNQNRREILNIVISPTQYYRKYWDYRKIHISKIFSTYLHNLVPVALLSDIVIISIIVIITLIIYRDMKFLLSPSLVIVRRMYSVNTTLAFVETQQI